jgi:CBS domain-containing protein
MATATQSFLALTAKDLMSHEVILIPEDMLMGDAARLLAGHRISGAPVVDAEGRCVGVLAATDFLRLVGQQATPERPAAAGPPCAYQRQRLAPDGTTLLTCTLAPGACRFQSRGRDAAGEEVLVCNHPECVLFDWEVVEVEQLPAALVREHMTADPVTAPAAASIAGLARQMIDAHIHRVIVVGEQGRPVGIVSSTDILAAVARAGSEA